MTYADAIDRASNLDALLTTVYRPLADAELRFTVIVEPMDLNPSSGTATTLEDAADIAFAFYDPS